MRAAVILAALLLSGCAGLGTYSGDVRITEHVYPTVEAAVAACRKHAPNLERDVKGCARWGDGWCVIHYPAGRWDTRQHEIRHCYEGHFHI